MASDKSSDNSDLSGTSDHLKEEETIVQEKPPPIAPKNTGDPQGATALNPMRDKIQTTSTPKDKGVRWAKFLASQFFDEEEWKSRKKLIESLNPKEKTRDRQRALQNFKNLLHTHGTELEQENVEATWRSLNKHFLHVKFSLSTITATREETRQLVEMEEHLRKFREDFNIQMPALDEIASVAEDVILRHELKFPGHIRAEQNKSLDAKSTSTVARHRHLEDWIDRIPEGQTDERKKELFDMATNNFLTFYKKQIENVLETDSAPRGFLDIVHQLERQFFRLQEIFDNMKQSEEDQELMVFIDRKYNDVKDHMAMLDQIDHEEPEDEEEIDAEIDSILNELNEFANSASRLRKIWPKSELAYLLCSWISQGLDTQLSEDQDSELLSLLQSFGKDRLKLTLHLWRSRLCETHSEIHKEVSHLLSHLLENWSVPEAEGNGSMWAAHATRFTRGNNPSSSLNEKFSVFLDPRNREQEEPRQNNMMEDATLQQQQPSAARRQPMAAPGGSLRAGLRSTQSSGNRLQGALNRANTTTPSRNPQQTATSNVDPIERLADLLERRTSSSRENHSALKLPPIKLQPFDGNPLEWVNWWPRYEALVHKRQDISESHKLLFLQQYVTEKAAKELWGAKIETLPYRKAINILFDKFADHMLLTGVYRDQLKKIPLPKSVRDVTGIRNFVDEVKKYMNCLREFKMLPHFYSLSTMDFYRANMPLDVLHEMADQEGKRISHFSLMEFTKALTKYVDLREDTSRYREHVGVRSLNSGSTTTMVTQTGPNRDGTYKLPADFSYYKCLYCGVKGTGGHLMMNCPTVKDPKKRYEIIQKLKRCSCCLSNAHRFYECTSQKTCFCQKKHHTSLHDWFTQSRNPGGNQSQGNRSNQQRGAPQQAGNRNQNPNHSNSQSQPSGN